MTDVRIQDFNENLKPDTNNDFLMTVLNRKHA